MAKSLAELRAQKDAPKVPHATLTATLIEGQHLLAEAETLYQERIELLAEREKLVREARRVDEDGNPTGPPRKSSETTELPPRVAEIDARVKTIQDREAALLPELAEHQADLGLRGMTGGEWQRWKNAHRAREDNRDDLQLTAGRCDSDALFNALASFVATWDGEELNDGDWDGWLAERIVYADRVAAVTAVVDMQESRVPKAPKSPTSSATPSESAD